MKQLNAIVYTSNAGHTKAYAELLGKETALPVYECKDALKILPRGSRVIYLGWLMGGTVKGYKRAAARFDVSAVCAVGMSGSDSQSADIRRINRLEDSLPVFCLQGGFEMDKLSGIYRMMMQLMKKGLGKKLAEKPHKTPEEEEMLLLINVGEDRVSSRRLERVVAWVRGV